MKGLGLMEIWAVEIETATSTINLKMMIHVTPHQNPQDAGGCNSIIKSAAPFDIVLGTQKGNIAEGT